ncbi:MAG: hypothetical protein MSA91_02675 [Lachnobacterium sp.]|nr:hypothetical protein [Lachnobacterium sp.]
MKMKEFLYDFFVRKNGRVQYEYERYVREHIDEHYLHRLRHLRLLLQLNWFYRVKRGNTPYIYWDTPLVENKPERKSKNIDKKTVTTNNIQKNEKEQKRETTVNEEKYPFISESEADKRTPMHIWSKGVVKYDVISFDIFDTLILRKVSNPTDVFIFIGERLGIIDFMSIRRNAEMEARKRHMAIYGNREIDIFDIYEIVHELTGLDVKVGVETEFEYEKKMCFANPYMYEAFKILKASNKKIYVCSDMYWPRDYMEQLLENCGYCGFADILVSCDYNGNKSNGVLFDVLNRMEANKKIIHIGDNYKADIEGAANKKIDTRYYRNVNEAGKLYRENGMSALARTAHQAIVNTTLHNGLNKYSKAYEYGFIYGGLYVLGYVCWIHKRASEEKLDKIVFLARDGYIYKQVYDALFDDIKSEYGLWSRMGSIKYTAEYSRRDFLTRMIDHKVDQGLAIASMLEMLGLGKLIEKLKYVGLKGNETIHSGNVKKLYSFFEKYWDDVIEEFKEEQEIAINYWKELVGESKNIALVDTGWRGDNQLNLKWLIKEKGKVDCNIKCYMAATITNERNISFIMDETLECYMFSSNKDRILYDDFCKNISINTALFELFTQAPHPSFDGFDACGNYMFGFAEVENYNLCREITNGIKDFCRIYIEWYGEYDFMFNISGYDVYIPFRGMKRNYNVPISAVGEYKFQQGVGIDLSKQTVKTLEELIEEKRRK